MRRRSADACGEERQGPSVREGSAVLVVGGAVPAVEAVICAGIDVDARAFAAGERLLYRLDRGGRNMRIVAGKMEQDRAFDFSGLLQLGMDAAAVIAHGRVHAGMSRA